MPPPTIVSHGDQVYSLDDGPLVLLGCAQDEVLQAFLECKDRTIGLLVGQNDDMDRYNLFDPSSPCAFVRLTAARAKYGYYCNRNLSAILKALKRGPLGPAIELPGRGKAREGFRVRIVLKRPD